MDMRIYKYNLKVSHLIDKENLKAWNEMSISS